MKLMLALCFSLVISSTYAAEQAASEASIKELIEITQSRKLMANMLAQIDTVMQNAMEQAVGKTRLSPKQQAVMNDMQQKLVTLLKTDMNWETLQSDVIAIYQQSFTEREITGMLDFYRTEAGQAVIKKMPLVMQHTVALMQKRMIAIMPKLRQIEEESIAKMKACCANED